jgi:hypothetical protein
MKINNKLLYSGMFAGAFSLAALGEAIAPGHGRDVAYCFHSYSFCQFMNGNMSPKRSAFVAFTVQSLGEVCQEYGLYPGTFDWNDFIAYGIGSALVFGTEKLIRTLKKDKEELSDIVEE